MDRAAYLKCIAELDCGKRLPGAVYVYRGGGVKFGDCLEALLSALSARYEFGPEFNVIKFRTDELKVSFLLYPHFISDAHPALSHGITVDLVSGNARHTDYGGNLNPPILHRKESFVPTEHPQRAEFEALTRAEEEAGLYKDTSTIGFKLNWEKLLEAKGLVITGHTLARREPVQNPDEPPAARDHEGVVVERHKTAMTRYELSKPVKSLLEYGLLRSGATFFDYGCGQGSDVRGLQGLGYRADGWDPVFQRDSPKREADVVNLGYVLNVIEDPAERLEALVDAHRLARWLLVASVPISDTVDTDRASAMRQH